MQSLDEIRDSVPGLYQEWIKAGGQAGIHCGFHPESLTTAYGLLCWTKFTVGSLRVIRFR